MRLLRKPKILLENVDNKSLSAVRSGRKSCLVNMTVVLSWWRSRVRIIGTLRSFSNDDGDGNENVKKAIGLLSKTTNLHVHLAFLYISQPPLQEYDVKMSNFTFYGGRKQATTNFCLSLSKLLCGPQEINSREIRPLLTFQANWNKRGKVWKNENSFFKVTFSQPSPSSVLSFWLDKRFDWAEKCVPFKWIFREIGKL